MSVPVGPRRLTSVRQVAIPAALLARVGLAIGSQVYFEVPEDDPTFIRIVPAAHVSEMSRHRETG